MAAVAREEPPPLGHIGELGRLIDGLLDKDPERRLTAAQARRVLDWAQEEAYAVSTPSMATPWSARRNTVGLASLLLLPLLMLAAVLVWTAPRATLPRATCQTSSSPCCPGRCSPSVSVCSPYRCGQH